ncbi:uncharacterized protein A1O5_06059 [Cladophialophora psammophila CBS 110553]|uniref:Fe2OG dioxygenase domain-containing protein n=1 Tax=Cladophialophora psammophila CBS 110553 TaxID=1182543 RepID=W9X2A8_9EURO|nr:uncharacterized protein A1O5_06059 [Cladophialophora psammophila CBS 110553]EXJ71066.1 hypothetical protein A1O5_06059 [Cladophialophora psammophila CBS 110553]
MATSFSTIPIIDFTNLQSAETKPQALKQLQDALFKVGFLYLINTGLESVVEEGHRNVPELFNLPPESKEKCNMINSPCFLGYTALGAETTASRTDLREQFDFGTPLKDSWMDGDPVWKRLEGPSQYPDAKTEDLVNRLIQQMSNLADSFLGSVAECLGLPIDTFAPFRGNMDRLKFIKYPPALPGSQGVGPHKDSTGLFTFLSQDSVGGLQVLNRTGQWIDAPPVPGSLVVNIAQGFEAITGGLCPATTHRVVAPTETVRYSIPYFLAVRYDLTLNQLKESAAHITRCIPASDAPVVPSINQVASEFLSPAFFCFGEASLRNRVISHPDVGQKWYPDLYDKYSRESF